jgi:RimJ/RimL family protein N-acetyltransferase
LSASGPDIERDLPLGPLVEASPAPLPGAVRLSGRYVDLAPLDPAAHGPALWNAVKSNDSLWAYLFDGPFPDEASFDDKLVQLSRAPGYCFYTILDRLSQVPLGWAALMRIEPGHRCVEVGYILYTPQLQRTPGATEAMYLLARYVFEDLGYRRYEWKCNALNAASRRAALRLGFTFEGIFRQHMIIKGRNRDTAWFAILDGEWPARRARLERWLRPSNFDSQGQQKTSLAKMALETDPDDSSPAS